MKKIYALALGLATVFAAGAQNDAKSLYESGKKAEDAFNKEIPSALTTGQMSPENAFAIVEAYNFYVKALPLDSVPNEKGKVKPVVSKKIVTSFVNHTKNRSFENAAIFLYQAGKQYPEAYQAFMIAGDLPRNPLVGKDGAVITDSIRSNNYYNAGLCAYSAKSYKESAEAFKKARLADPTNVDNFVYEIASYQYADFEDQALKESTIFEAAQEAYKYHGAKNIFIFNNYVNKFFNNDEIEAANAILSEAEKNEPENGNVQLLFGLLKNKEQKYDQAAEYFRKAGNLSNVYGTLLDASKQLNLLGKNALNEIDFQAENAAELKAEVKKNYFEKALEIANKAKALPDANNQINNIIDDINYSLENYFN